VKTQRSFRLRPDEDGELEQWLGDYAAHGQQADVIRLALYRLAGMAIPPSLRGVAGLFEDGVPQGQRATPPGHLDLSPVADLAHEVRDLVRAFVARDRVAATTPAIATSEIEGSGLRMDGDRPRARPKAGQGVAFTAAMLPKTDTKH
jgi:hypothetical protein